MTAEKVYFERGWLACKHRLVEISKRNDGLKAGISAVVFGLDQEKGSAYDERLL